MIAFYIPLVLVIRVSADAWRPSVAARAASSTSTFLTEGHGEDGPCGKCWVADKLEELVRFLPQDLGRPSQRVRLEGEARLTHSWLAAAPSRTG